MKVLKTFIESEEKYALVCEDDIKIDSKIKEILDIALNSDIKFDLLRLSGGSNPSIEKGIPVKLRQLTDKYHLALNFGFKSGTGSYLINRKAAEAIEESGLGIGVFEKDPGAGRNDGSRRAAARSRSIAAFASLPKRSSGSSRSGGSKCTPGPTFHTRSG